MSDMNHRFEKSTEEYKRFTEGYEKDDNKDYIPYTKRISLDETVMAYPNEYLNYVEEISNDGDDDDDQEDKNDIELECHAVEGKGKGFEMNKGINDSEEDLDDADNEDQRDAGNGQEEDLDDADNEDQRDAGNGQEDDAGFMMFEGKGKGKGKGNGQVDDYGFPDWEPYIDEKIFHAGNHKKFEEFYGSTNDEKWMEAKELLKEMISKQIFFWISKKEEHQFNFGLPEDVLMKLHFKKKDKMERLYQDKIKDVTHIFQEIEALEEKNYFNATKETEDITRLDQLKTLIVDKPYFKILTLSSETRLFKLQSIAHLRIKVAQWLSSFNICTKLLNDQEEITIDHDNKFMKRNEPIILSVIIDIAAFENFSDDVVVRCLINHLACDDINVLKRLEKVISNDKYQEICDKTLIHLRESVADELSYFYCTGIDQSHSARSIGRSRVIKVVEYLVNYAPININQIGFCAHHPGHNLLMWVCCLSDFWKGFRVSGIVKQLIAAQVDVNESGPKGQSALTYACQKQDPEVVSILISAGADINQCDLSGKNVLFWAIKFNSLNAPGEAVIRILLYLGINIHQRDQHGFTPLMWACIYHRQNAIKILLAAHANVYDRCKKGLDPLMWACRSRMLLGDDNEVIKLLLSQNADVTNRSNTGMDGLMWASKTHLKDFCSNPAVCYTFGHDFLTRYYSPEIIPEWKKHYDRSNLVELLIKEKSDISRCDDRGKNALMYGCMSGNEKIVKSLLAAQCDVDACDKKGIPTFLQAIECTQDKIVELLISSEVDVHVCKPNGNNALLVSLDCKSDPNYYNNARQDNIIQLLLNANVSPETRNKAGMNLLMYFYFGSRTDFLIQTIFETTSNMENDDNLGCIRFLLACFSDDIEKVKLLLEKKADLENYDNDGNNGLLLAVERQSESMINFLLERGININKCNNDGNNALFLALRKRNEPMAQILIDANIDVNNCNNDGNNALQLIIQERIGGFATHLIYVNIDINNCNNDGNNSFLLACQFCDDNILRMLIERNADIYKCNNLKKNAIFYAMEQEWHKIDNLFLLLQFTSQKKVRLRQHMRGRMPINHTNKYFDLNHTDHTNSTALIVASKKNIPQMMELLLIYQADVTTCDQEGKSALMYAVQNTSHAIVIKLLDQKADVNECDCKGQSILMYAVLSKVPQLVNTLLRYKADVNECDHNGKNALLHAATKKIEKLEEVIGRRFGNPFGCGKGKGKDRGHGYRGRKRYIKKWEPYNQEVGKGEGKGDLHKPTPPNIQIMQLLLRPELNFYTRDKDGMDAFLIGCQNNQKDTVELLVQSKANINSVDNEKQSGLIWGIKNRHTNIIHYLLSIEVDIHLCDKNGMSAILWASKMGCQTIVELLLKYKADPVTCDHHGMNSLMWASKNLRTAVVKQLLELNIDPEQPDNNGQTAYNIAFKNDPHHVVIKLLDHKKI